MSLHLKAGHYLWRSRLRRLAVLVLDAIQGAAQDPRLLSDGGLGFHLPHRANGEPGKEVAHEKSRGWGRRDIPRPQFQKRKWAGRAKYAGRDPRWRILQEAGGATSSRTRVNSQSPPPKSSSRERIEVRESVIRAVSPIRVGPSTAANFPTML